MNILHTHYTYFLVLLIGISGIWILDYRYKLVFYKNLKAACKSIVLVMGLLLLFDILGILNNIFATNTLYTLGFNIISTNMPFEELLFLFLLCYVTLLTYALIKLRTHHE